MRADELERFQRERRDADARYNDALTTLDRSVLAATAKDSWTRDDLGALSTALIVYLQQITAFVESKDRELTADVDARLSRIEQALAPLAELRTQIGVLTRRVEGLSRQSPVPSDQSLANTSPKSQIPNPRDGDGRGAAAAVYVAFEDEFRGSADEIRARLESYIPLFAGAIDVVDLGCGRGEMLDLLKAAGVSASGVDANGDMAAIARERGLQAVQGDALAYLASRVDGSLGGLIATQVVEHLEPSYLLQLLGTAAAKLRPGAPIVLETINPACWLAFFSSYIRDFTHVRPIHPETLQYLLRASGFERVEIRYSQPVPDHMRMRTIDLPPGLDPSSPSSAALDRIAQAINANAVILNNLMFSHLDYAAIGYRA